MGTYKRSSKGIVDEKGNIVKSFMIPSNDVQGQVSMEFNSENDVSIISSEAEKEPILEESGLPASIEKNEMTLWDEAGFYDNFEDNAKEALQMLLSVQSNENPNKKGGEDIGFVGDITEVNPKILYDLLEKDFLPIVFPIGFDDNYDSYNINADDAACAIARAMKAEKLAFLTDIEGVYRNPEDTSSLISELFVNEAKALIENGNVGGGMIPKLQNCIDAIESGVNRVHILDGRIQHCLLLEIFTNKGIGTAILRESEGKYYNEENK